MVHVLPVDGPHVRRSAFYQWPMKLAPATALAINMLITIYVGLCFVLQHTWFLCVQINRSLHLGPVAPISVNFNHQLTQHHRRDNSNSRATSANSSSIK